MTEKPKCTACPECGDEETENDDLLAPGYRVCSVCGQEWYTDIDYPSHILKGFRP